MEVGNNVRQSKLHETTAVVQLVKPAFYSKEVVLNLPLDLYKLTITDYVIMFSDMDDTNAVIIPMNNIRSVSFKENKAVTNKNVN